jgi:regulator of sigma E protease
VIHAPGFIWSVLFFLVAIGPLIVGHELGHYLVARWLGVKSEVFSIGFGREIVGWSDKRGTRWKLAWIPLGGYVRFAGDMNAASMPDDEWQKLPEAERAVTFPAQPVWKRFLIVLAGPFANFLLATLIIMGFVATNGDLQAPPVIAQLVPGSAAARAGFVAGDRIVAVDGRSIDRFTDIGNYVVLRPKQLMTFDLVRAGKDMKIVAAPDENVRKDQFGNATRIGLMGMAPASAKFVPVPLLRLPGVALRQTGEITVSMADGLGQMITGRRSPKEMGGMLRIAKMSGEQASLGWLPFVGFIAMISINLGFINLFYVAEVVRGRPVSQKAQEWAFRSGFALVLGLMLFVTLNDLLSFGLFGRAAG